MSESLHTVPGVLERVPVSRSKLYGLMRTGELRSVKVGGRRLIPESALVEFMATVQAQQEGRAWKGSGDAA